MPGDNVVAVDDREFTTDQLNTVLQRVGIHARERARKAGISQYVLRNGMIIEIAPNGTQRVYKALSRSAKN